MGALRLRLRYWRIVAFFVRAAVGVIVWENLLPKLGLGALSRRTRARRTRAIAARFRTLATGIQGLLIKMGQFLSARVDVLPPEITDELASLQDEVPAVPFAAIRALAEEELGMALTTAFASLDERPLAAASLGQAHRARLRDDVAALTGFTDVVVKVQRPGIRAIVDTDLAALRQAARMLQHYRPVARRADAPALMEEFALTSLAELDYLAEAGNAEHFAEIFADEPRIRVPRVVWDHTTRRVLTLEDVSAIRIGDHAALDAARIPRRAVAEQLVQAYLTQIFDHDVFHADPHPGNLFVEATTDADGNPDWRLTFIDFGMIGRVPDHLRDGLREVLLAVATQDGPRLIKSFRTLNLLFPSADDERLAMASTQVFDRFGGMTMGDLQKVDPREVAALGLQFSELLRDLPFQLPENLLLLGRTVAILSGMCTGLDPDFNLWVAIAPYADELVSGEAGARDEDRWFPGSSTLLEEGRKLLQTAVALPGRAERVLRTVERGELSVRVPLLELRMLRLDRGMRRIANALVFVGLILAGAVLHPSDPSLGDWLLRASVLPLLAVVFGGGRRHGPL